MRILLISASAGAGHVRAAQALEKTAAFVFPDDDVQHVDILDFTGSVYRKAYARSFLAMVNHAPALWGYLYAKSDRVPSGKGFPQRLVRFFDRLEFDPFRRFVREFRPDVVVATHFLPCQVFAPSRTRGRDRFPLAVVVTDFDVHAYWVQKTADLFFVASDELRARLSDHGLDAGRIAVSGIPISPAFAKSHDVARIRESLALQEGLPTVLVMSGGGGVGSPEEAVAAVLDGPPVQVLAVAGRNTELKSQLEALRVPKGSLLRVFGFVSTIEELMAVSNLAVTKSGGLTTSECLAMGLPMVIRDPIPGQEERNADFVLEAGAGVKANGLASLRFKVRELLGNPSRLASMGAAARQAGKANAAETILRALPRGV